MIVFFCSRQLLIQILNKTIILGTDYGRPVRKPPSLHGRKSTPTPKFLVTAEAYFVCHIGPNFQIFFYLCLHWLSVVRGSMVLVNLESYNSCSVLAELQKLKFIYSEKATKNMKISPNFF